jgi:hypothetical protein
MPPVPGLDTLDGVWTNREATGLTEVPRKLLVLGGGPVGVEMAQAVRRLGGEVALIEGHAHVLPREPPAVGEALGRALVDDGVELHFGQHATAAARTATRSSSTSPTARSCAATGCSSRRAAPARRRPGARAGRHRRRGARHPGRRPHVGGPGLWAIGDVAGIWPLTYVGKYQARIAAANILGGDRRASYDAVPRVVFCDPQAASVGDATGAVSATTPLSGVAKTATYTRDYADQHGFLTLVSDGEVLTGAYAVGPTPASGSSRPRSRCARASRSPSCATRSSRSRRSRRSTSTRSSSSSRPPTRSAAAAPGAVGLDQPLAGGPLERLGRPVAERADRLAQLAQDPRALGAHRDVGLEPRGVGGVEATVEVRAGQVGDVRAHPPTVRLA